jgi:hypothetical protein
MERAETGLCCGRKEEMATAAISFDGMSSVLIWYGQEQSNENDIASTHH